MVKGCCVPFCNTQRGNKISLHEIPSDLNMRTEWLQAIPLKDFIPLDHSKVCANHFQKSDFLSSCRAKRLKKNAIPSIFEGCPTIITDKGKNYVVKQSSKHSSDFELVQTSESEKSQTQINLSSVPSKQVTELNSSPINSVGSRFNLPSIVVKQPITPSFFMKKNVKSIYVLDKNKTTTPMKEAAQTVTNKCTSFNIENNYPGLLKRKADVNNCVNNNAKMLIISSTPKNKAVSFSVQSTCSSNETLSVLDTEKGTTSASQLSHQLVSQGLPSDDEAVTTSDMNNEGVGGVGNAESETEMNQRNVPSNRFTGITNNRSNQAGTQINHSRVTTSAASRELSKQTSLPTKYFNANSYKFISELRHKNKNMISLLCKKNKKIRLLQSKLEEMSEKLEYFENHEVMRKVEKLLVINDKGLASNQIKFLLSQLSNLDKKTPRWPDDIVRECVLLHASSPKCYEALQKSELIKLFLKIVIFSSSIL
ncbi:hypothetical protein JTE90_024123 [Oedothorax gibbosus]|uniref:THAP-type domain-containing protein n=1 Tax=Oedothorax gibbosus TaxID=931172 RepID=A0AAV6TM16_9ARAC|nr:hypothetical protein JTE90_024123 [Oedothorax gibbosus]